LLGNSDLLEKMGRAARREAEIYSWAKTAKEIEDLYEHLLKN